MDTVKVTHVRSPHATTGGRPRCLTQPASLPRRFGLSELLHCLPATDSNVAAGLSPVLLQEGRRGGAKSVAETPTTLTLSCRDCQGSLGICVLEEETQKPQTILKRRSIDGSILMKLQHTLYNYTHVTLVVVCRTNTP